MLLNCLGTNETALRTCDLFRDLVDSSSKSSSQWVDQRQLFASVRKLGKRLSEADRMNFTVANVVKRIYHIIREECHALKISLKDHHSFMGVPKDTMRLDSLKSINLQSNRQGNILDQIDEDEDDEASVKAIGVKHQGSLSSGIGSLNQMQKLKNNVLSSIDNLREDIENVPEIIAS